MSRESVNLLEAELHAEWEQQMLLKLWGHYSQNENLLEQEYRKLPKESVKFGYPTLKSSIIVKQQKIVRKKKTLKLFEISVNVQSRSDDGTRFKIPPRRFKWQTMQQMAPKKLMEISTHDYWPEKLMLTFYLSPLFFLQLDYDRCQTWDAGLQL